ncbi:CG0192-related protein [Microlunatus ginsengisoli]|uniref:CG0192-related protein n=1 Tax=Microlunatus ginsengisoli TaxID=363863 RepID=UPI0031D3BF13
MALIYDAELTPSKPDLLTEWVPRQSWFAGDAAARVRILGSYRFDDPAGEVGIETFLVRFGDGPVLQVPLTYRGRPLDDRADAAEVEPITTMQHSVLGTRWVYDGPHDPAYVAALASAVLTGGSEAKLLMSDGTELPSRGSVQGSGAAADGVAEPASLDVIDSDGATACVTPDYTLAVRRLVEPGDAAAADVAGAETLDLRLTGTWAGSPEQAVLVVLSGRASSAVESRNAEPAPAPSTASFGRSMPEPHG